MRGRSTRGKGLRVGGFRRTVLSAARSGRTVTYGTLMKRHGLSRGASLTRAIAEVDRAELAHGAPGFAAIIVRKDTGFPGGGYFCDDSLPEGLERPRERSSDPRLSKEEKEHVLNQQRTIWGYYGARRARPTT